MALKPIQADGLASVEVVFRIVCHAVQVIGDAVLGSVLGILERLARHGCVESRKQVSSDSMSQESAAKAWQGQGLTRTVVPQVGAVCPQWKCASWRGCVGRIKR